MTAVGIIFSEIHDHNLPEITKKRTLGSVPFGGRYRLIDFVLSNMVNSGITSVGVIARNNYHSLMSHLGSGKEWDLSRKFGGLTVFPPYSLSSGAGLYSGRLDAMKSILSTLEKVSDDYVVLADCDTVCNMDYTDIIKYHADKNADITVIYQRKQVADKRLNSTIYEIGEDGRVNSAFVGIAPDFEDNVSLGMWIVNRNLLITLIREAIAVGRLSFEKDIIAKRAGSLKIYGYNFAGYAAKIDSNSSLFQANMDLLDSAIRNEVFKKNNPIYTRVRDEAPTRYASDVTVKNSLIANGSVVLGDVENSVISRGVHIGKGAKVKNCVIMQGAVIGDNANISYAIIDKHCVIKDGRVLSGHETYPFVLAKDTIV